MTVKEAINRIQWLKTRTYDKGTREMFEMSEDALDKRLKKKPTEQVNDSDVKIGNVIFRKGTKTYKCKCGAWITKTCKYCHDCGQAIDWSEY